MAGLFDGKSITGQSWALQEADDAIVRDISLKANVSDFTARLLASRGVGAEEAEDFLEPSLRKLMPDPSSFLDMDKAAGLILDAMGRGDKITVFADYDVDGGTSAAQLIHWAREMGHEFGLYVPDRISEGYGPSVDALIGLKEQGVDLVITVDCGAAAMSPLQAAHEAGLPVIVIDHHQMDPLHIPPAAALVNPNHPEDTSGQGHLAAAGVVFVMLAALNREARKRGKNDLPDLRKLLGLTSLGTVCDVVPLQGVNRAFVRQGFKVINQRQNPGLSTLCEVSGLGTDEPFSTYQAGFVVGPRINAGGRIGQADLGAKLLSDKGDGELISMAQTLDGLNKERREMQDVMLSEALELADQEPDDAPMIILSRPNWHPGLIGIVAGRLKDRFYKPAIVIGELDDGTAKGSGRSISGVDLGAAVTAARKAGLLTSGGGHAMAAGLSAQSDKLATLKAFLFAHVQDDVQKARADRALKIDAIVQPAAANLELLDEIDRIGPYGAGHPQPVFALEALTLSYAERLRGGHVRFSFRDGGGQILSGICFRADETEIGQALLSGHERLFHVAGRFRRNSWKGRVKVDFQLADLKSAE